MTRTAKREKDLQTPINDNDQSNAVALFSDEQLKHAEMEIIKAQNAYAIKKGESDIAKAAIRTAYNNAEKMGIPVAPFKFILENLNKFDPDFKAEVNALQQRRNEAPVFAFLESADFPLVKHH